MDPNQTQLLESDSNRTVLGAAPTLDATQTIKPVQCPVCKTRNPPGVMFCVECGLIFDRALPDDAFGAPVVRLPVLVERGGREHPLRAGANVVGREGDVVLADPKVSRRHALIVSENGELTLQDLGSTNGTELNGEKLIPGEKRPLKQGDKVSFGGVELTLSLPGQAGSTELLSPNKTALGAPPSVSEDERDSDTPDLRQPVAYLIVEGEQKPLKAGINTFGRKADNDVQVADPYVSGRHGKIEVSQEGIFLTDVGSTNGTFLNGTRLTPNVRTLVTPQDEIRIGGLLLSVREPDDRRES